MATTKKAGGGENRIRTHLGNRAIAFPIAPHDELPGCRELPPGEGGTDPGEGFQAPSKNERRRNFISDRAGRGGEGIHSAHAVVP
jgi:hypothetical protein